MLRPSVEGGSTSIVKGTARRKAPQGHLQNPTSVRRAGGQRFHSVDGGRTQGFGAGYMADKAGPYNDRSAAESFPACPSASAAPNPFCTAPLCRNTRARASLWRD